MLERIAATRFVTPLREGGSLPGIVEADDLGTYVCKFRGAGQGLRVLVAEVVVGELARRLGLRIPVLRAIDLSAPIASYEADQEVQELLNASLGLNLGTDFLPGSFGWDGSCAIDADEAAAIVWLDSLTANVDRSWRNPNLLVWHGQVWLIDHGAALYFHHSWPSRPPDAARFAAQPYDASDHVLRSRTTGAALAAADQRLRAMITATLLGDVLAAVPDEWLELGAFVADPAAARQAYIDHLLARAADPSAWLPGTDA
jgi:hypothetical protein